MGEIKVLIADDDPNLLDLMARRLKRMGYEPETASDGRAALVAIKRTNFDLIVTDIYMPGADGLEILRQAKEIDPYIQVVVVTGSATLDNAVVALNNGAFGYMNKPFEHLSVFDKTIEHALEFRRLVLANMRMAEAQRRRGDLLQDEVTDRILQLQQKQKEAQELLACLPDSVMVIDSSGKVILRNPAADRMLDLEKLASRQPIQEFITSLKSKKKTPPQTIEVKGQTLVVRAVPLPGGDEKDRVVVIMQEKDTDQLDLLAGLESSTDEATEMLKALSEFQNLFKGLPDGIVLVNENGDFDPKNPVAVRWLANETKWDTQPIRDFIASVAEMNQPSQVSVEMNGVELNLRSVPLPPDIGADQKVVIIQEAGGKATEGIQDLGTAQVGLPETVTSTHELMDLLTHLPDGIIVFSIDGEIIYQNSIAEELRSLEAQNQSQAIQEFMDYAITQSGMISRQIELAGRGVLLRSIPLPEDDGVNRRAILMQETKNDALENLSKFTAPAARSKQVVDWLFQQPVNLKTAQALEYLGKQIAEIERFAQGYIEQGPEGEAEIQPGFTNMTNQGESGQGDDSP